MCAGDTDFIRLRLCLGNAERKGPGQRSASARCQPFYMRNLIGSSQHLQPCGLLIPLYDKGGAQGSGGYAGGPGSHKDHLQRQQPCVLCLQCPSCLLSHSSSPPWCVAGWGGKWVNYLRMEKFLFPRCRRPAPQHPPALGCGIVLYAPGCCFHG